MKNLVEFTNVTKNYSGNLVVDNVSFNITQSSINILIGPNGSGKSTIAKLLLMLEKPSSGKIKLNKNIKYSYVPQKFNFSELLPIKAVDFLSSLNISFEKLLNYGLLNDSNLEDLKNNQLVKLSGGTLQRFMLAVSIAQEPDLIVLDEPTSNLDLEGTSKFYELVEKINNEHKIAFFLISHDLHNVMKSSKQVLCLNHHICCRGKPNVSQLEIKNFGSYIHKHDHTHS